MFNFFQMVSERLQAIADAITALAASNGVSESSGTFDVNIDVQVLGSWEPWYSAAAAGQWYRVGQLVFVQIEVLLFGSWTIPAGATGMSFLLPAELAPLQGSTIDQYGYAIKSDWLNNVVPEMAIRIATDGRAEIWAGQWDGGQTEGLRPIAELDQQPSNQNTLRAAFWYRLQS